MEYIISHSNLLKEIELKGDDSGHFGVYNGSVFKLGSVTAQLIEKLKSKEFCQSFAEVVETYDLNKEDIEYLIGSLNRLVDNITKSGIKKKYIKLSFTILGGNLVNQVASRLSFLFKKTIVLLFVLSAIIGHFYVFSALETNYGVGQNHITLTGYFIIFITVFIIALMHELGHSAASCYFGVHAKEIGFGFYIFFPVLFSNVTEIWVLNKFKRVWVNLSGLYFQAIISIPLLILLIIFDKSPFASLLHYLVMINLFMAAYSIIPFIRNDGYWIISDLVEISDLNKQANIIPIKVLKQRSLRQFNKWVILYSFLSYFFIVFLAFFLIDGLIDNISYILTLSYHDNLLLLIRAHAFKVISILFSFFFLILLLRTFKNWINMIKVELKP